MDTIGDVDQFLLLEKKIDYLIERVNTLARERDALAEKVQIQEEKLSDTTEQLSDLKEARDKARQKIVDLLEKIEQVGI